MSDIAVIQVMACSNTDLYGIDDKLPWHVPQELANFKSITTTPNSAVVVSLPTLATIPNHLVGRSLYGLSRVPSAYTDQRQHYHQLHQVGKAGNLLSIHDNPKDIIDDAISRNMDVLYVIGGGPIWAAFESYYTHRYISVIDSDLVSDAKGTRYFYSLRPDRRNAVINTTKRDGYTFVEYGVKNENNPETKHRRPNHVVDQHDYQRKHHY